MTAQPIDQQTCVPAAEGKVGEVLSYMQAQPGALTKPTGIS